LIGRVDFPFAKGGFVPPLPFDDHLVLIKRLLDSEFTEFTEKLLPLQIYFVDASPGRPLAAPGDELFDAVGSSFRQHLDGTIIAIHDPAG
jgi:hypothetical protein